MVVVLDRRCSSGSLLLMLGYESCQCSQLLSDISRYLYILMHFHNSSLLFIQSVALPSDFHVASSFHRHITIDFEHSLKMRSTKGGHELVWRRNAHSQANNFFKCPWHSIILHATNTHTHTHYIYIYIYIVLWFCLGGAAPPRAPR